MTTAITRRRFLAHVGPAGAAAGAATMLGAPAIVRGQQPIPIVTATLSGGWAELGNRVLMDQGFGERAGLKFSNYNTYSSLANYYTDITKGTVEVGIGAWDAFAKMYEKGVPVTMIGVIATGSMVGLFTRAGGPTSIAALKGKTVAAMQASGTYTMTKTWVKLFDNLEFEKDIQVQNAPNPSATVTLVAGERADAALSWEHSLSVGLHKVPGSQIGVNIGEYYKKHTNHEMPFFGIVLRNDWIAKHPKGTVAKVVKAYGDMIEWVHQNEDAFANRFAEIKLDPAIVKTAIGSGRMRMAMRSMADPKNREDVLYCHDLMHKAGAFEKKLDDGFFAA
jgi:NitT/TauT family transport system substrate-binding protein